MAATKKRKDRALSAHCSRASKTKQPTHCDKAQTSIKNRQQTSDSSNKSSSSNNNSDSTAKKSMSLALMLLLRNNISVSDSDFLFPKWTGCVLWLALTACRVMYVVQPSNWWILHPDEVFQSFEVAHTEAYGYGFRPYEFSSLSQGGLDGANVSMYRQRELELGMHGMRSALYPRFYVAVSLAVWFFGLDIRPFVLWKASHAVVSSLLPLSVFHFAKVYFRSHDAACLAAIFVTLSSHLNVLGTHPLLNGFLAPAAFWAMAGIIPLLRGSWCSDDAHCSDCERTGVKYSREALKSCQKNERRPDSNGGGRPEETRKYASNADRGSSSKNSTSTSNNNNNGQSNNNSSANHNKYSDYNANDNNNNDNNCSYPPDMNEREHRNGHVHEKEHLHFDSSHTNHEKANGRDYYQNEHRLCNGENAFQNHNQKPSDKGIAMKDTQKFDSGSKDIKTANSETEKLPSVSDRTKGLCSDRRIPGIDASKLREDNLYMNGVEDLNACGSHRNGVNELKFGSCNRNEMNQLNGDSTRRTEMNKVNAESSNRNGMRAGRPGPCFSTGQAWPPSARNTLTSSFMKYFLNGFILSLCIYIRLDIALLACLTLLPTFSPRKAKYWKLCGCALGACAGFCVGVYEDFRFYGEIVVSPGNWAKFNVFNDWSATFFGKSSVFRYLTLLFEGNSGFCALACVSVASFVYLVYDKYKSQLLQGVRVRKTSDSSSSNSSGNSNSSSSNSNNDSINNKSYKQNSSNQNNRRLHESKERTKGDIKTTITLFISCSTLFVFYSLQAHKELRFIHNVLVLLLTIFASLCGMVLARIYGKISREETWLVVFTLLFIFAASQWMSFPSAKDQSNSAWAYQRHWDSHDVNGCLAYVGEQNDVTGVFLDRNFHVTGGYSLLHKDVPLFTLLVYEFVEFDAASKIHLGATSFLNPQRNISFVTLDRLANYVSVQNAAYLVKLLIASKHYNYFVIGKDRRFLPVGFTEVFTHGTMRVMKRNYDSTQEGQLLAMASRTPVGVNATVLRYEGDVLFRFQRFRLAAQRYHASLQMDARGHLFQALAACERNLGNMSEAEKWISVCVERFGEADCAKPISMININPDRPLF